MGPTSFPDVVHALGAARKIGNTRDRLTGAGYPTGRRAAVTLASPSIVGEVTDMRRAAATLLLAALASSTSACGGSPAEDVCDAACDCNGCTDPQRQTCVDQLEQARDGADDAGCGGELDDYLECVATAEGLCEDPQLTSVCTSERSEVEACAAGG